MKAQNFKGIMLKRKFSKPGEVVIFGRREGQWIEHDFSFWLFYNKRIKKNVLVFHDCEIMTIL